MVRTAGAKLSSEATPAATRRSATPWAAAAGVAMATVYPAPSVDAVPNFDGNHKGGVIHRGGICQSGTTCAATGQDRRLGDYFTNALDQNGCVMIASGDTMQNAPITNQPLPNSLPIFLQQTSGPSLTTGADCAALQVGVPEVSTVFGLVMAGAVGALLANQVRRRRARARLS